MGLPYAIIIMRVRNLGSFKVRVCESRPPNCVEIVDMQHYLGLSGHNYEY